MYTHRQNGVESGDNNLTSSCGKVLSVQKYLLEDNRTHFIVKWKLSPHLFPLYDYSND